MLPKNFLVVVEVYSVKWSIACVKRKFFMISLDQVQQDRSVWLNWMISIEFLLTTYYDMNILWNNPISLFKALNECFSY